MRWLPIRRLLWAIPVAAFFLNPSLACGPAPPAYEYGAPEMRAAVAGTWSLAFTPDGGQPTRVTISVEQATGTPTTTASAAPVALVRAALACGTRTLLRPAAACVDISEMPLAVTFVSGDAALATATFTGTFEVIGTQFISGDLDLVVGPYHIAARLDPFGTIIDARLAAPGPAGALTVVTHEP